MTCYSHSGCSLVAFLLVTAAACQPAQHVIYIDTDAPIAGQILAEPRLSPDAAIDMVRIDTLGAHGELIDVCIIQAPDPSDWPISFGVAPGSVDGPYYVRVRGFRSMRSNQRDAAGFRSRCGGAHPQAEPASINEPWPESTIDRVAALPAIGSSLSRWRIDLSLSCMGASPSFIDSTTCIDGSERSAPSARAMPEQTDNPTRSEVSTLAWEKDCAPPPPGVPDRICIKGGFSLQGDYRYVNYGDDKVYDPVPLRAVHVAPFYIDQTEYTVERLRRTLLTHPEIAPPVPENEQMPMYQPYCTWTLPNPQLPVNCFQWRSAQAACAAAQGSLPTEAQWDHAARGRGRGRTYPWGEEFPGCQRGSFGRKTAGPIAVQACAGEGPEPVGSHRSSPTNGGGDESLDRVVDMGGSMHEYLMDSVSAYAERCGLLRGVTEDPLCLRPDRNGHMARGGWWSAGPGIAAGAIRYPAVNSSIMGFRCVYPGVKP